VGGWDGEKTTELKGKTMIETRNKTEEIGRRIWREMERRQQSSKAKKHEDKSTKQTKETGRRTRMKEATKLKGKNHGDRSMKQNKGDRRMRAWEKTRELKWNQGPWC
jgi:hypothetical protein